MSRIHSKQVELAKRILETMDEQLLQELDDLVNGKIGYQFTKAQIAEFEERLRRYEAGEVGGVPWGDVQKRLVKKLGGGASR